MLFMLNILGYITISNAFVIHRVNEGQVGIYYNFGKLNEHITDPGIHSRMPWPITYTSEVQITPQTDTITNVKCGAGDGTQLIFDQIDVGNYLEKDYVYKTIKRFGEKYDNYLVKDKVRAQINVICSGLTSQEIYIDKFHTLDDLLLNYLQEENNKEENSGVVVQFVRMSKPTLPKTLQDNYDKIANEKTARKVAEEQKLRLEQENNNKLLVAAAEAEKRRVVAEKENMILIEKKRNDEELNKIDNRIKKEKALTEAKIIFERKEKEAAGNKLLHTTEYLELEKSKSYLNNAKHYFGKIPTTLFIKDDTCSVNEELSSLIN